MGRRRREEQPKKRGWFSLILSLIGLNFILKKLGLKDDD